MIKLCLHRWKKSRYNACFFLFLTLSACKVSTINPKANRVEQVYFFQNGTSIGISEDVSTIKLKRDKFAIQSFNKKSDVANKKYYYTRIAAVPNQEEFDKIAIGSNTVKMKNFGPGTALAISTRKGYDKKVFINDYGHHILFYGDEENRTVSVIGKKKEFLLFEFEVGEIFEEGNFIPVEEITLDTFYFAIFSDFNQNKIMDQGELKKVIVVLE